jgi:hypothetical protein
MRDVILETEMLRSELAALRHKMATKADVARLGNRIINRLVLILLGQTFLIVALIKLLP